MTDRELRFAPPARADLDEIFWRIAQDNAARAFTYASEILDACELLRSSPMMGVGRPDLRDGLRIMPLWRRIVIAYELPPGQVDVLRIFSGGQDYEAILASAQTPRR